MHCQGGVRECLWRLSRLKSVRSKCKETRRAVHSSPVATPPSGTPPPPLPEVIPAKTTIPPPSRSKGSGPFLLLSATVCAAGGAGLYYYFYVDPAAGAQALAPADPPTSPVTLLEPPRLSAQDEMRLKRDMLRAELEHLRSQKRTKTVDVKKKEIKDDLKVLDKKIRDLND